MRTRLIYLGTCITLVLFTVVGVVRLNSGTSSNLSDGYSHSDHLHGDEENRQDSVSGIIVHGLLAYLTLPELIEESDVIVIGTVGETVAVDYPRMYRSDTQIDEELDRLSENDKLLWDRIAFQQIEINDTIRGNPKLPFILGRDDVEYYSHIDLKPLLEGEKIVLFASNSVQPRHITNKLEHFYVTRGDNGIFDIDRYDRAFPRTPENFLELITEEGQFFSDDSLQAYIELSKLKEIIERY